MDPNKANPSQLELLPQDLLGDIIARVAAESGADYVNAISSCKELKLSALDERVAKRLNLTALKKNPINALRLYKLMEKCLKENNTDAHYIEGINLYFLFLEKDNGLTHLKIAADAGCDEAAYLYAVLLLGTGHIEQGKRYLRPLHGASDNTRVDNAWAAVKVSLRRFRYKKNKSYITHMVNVSPDPPCEHAFISETCQRCFEYTALYKYNRWAKLI